MRAIADALITLDAPEARLRLVVCTASRVAREARSRHSLAPGSAAALAQGLTAALLLAAHERTRVDVQLECNGPLRGLLVDGDQSGAVRGLVRASGLEGGSILRAPAAGEPPHRAAFPFAGADLGAALTLFLRGDREQGGEMALEVLVSAREPLAAVAGVVVAPREASDQEKGQMLGKPLRQGGLAEALRGADGAMAVAEAIARAFDLGPLHPRAQVEPRFACRCSRDRVVRALRSLGAPELGDMAARDGGARLTCDFCNAAYSFSAAELLQIAQV